MEDIKDKIIASIAGCYLAEVNPAEAYKRLEDLHYNGHGTDSATAHVNVADNYVFLSIEELLEVMDPLIEAASSLVREVYPFPNGFQSWQETHFEVVNAIAIKERAGTSKSIGDIVSTQGVIALYDLAEELTNKFERMYPLSTWECDGDYLDTIEEFLNEELI